jgi:hypothetical protein
MIFFSMFSWHPIKSHNDLLDTRRVWFQKDTRAVTRLSDFENNSG